MKKYKLYCTECGKFKNVGKELFHKYDYTDVKFICKSCRINKKNLDNVIFIG